MSTNVMGFDEETTGLDTTKDRIVEASFVVWNVEQKKPIYTRAEYLYASDYPPINLHAARSHGIDDETVKKYGIPPTEFLKIMLKAVSAYDIKAFVTHNGSLFDMPMLATHIECYGCLEALALLDILNIDTRFDLPLREGISSKSLNNLAYEHEFLNPFKHRALFDVMTDLKVFSFYPFEVVMENAIKRTAIAKAPKIVIQAIGVKYETPALREEAKSLGFKFNAKDDKNYPAMWTKEIQEHELEEIVGKASFPIKSLGPKKATATQMALC
jgi:DNA polymerase III subunit epsilon